LAAGLSLVLAAAGQTGVGLAYFYKPPVAVLGATASDPAAFLARHYQLIILTHADEGFRDELRQNGYRGPLLQYIAPNEAEGPGPYANSHAHCDARYPTYQRTVVDRVGAFCRDVHPHEDWFLHDGRGRRLYDRYQSANGVWRTSYAMNPASSGWRKYLIHRLRQYEAMGWRDGFFLDNVDLTRARLLRQAKGEGLKEFADDAAWRKAESGLLHDVRRAFPQQPLWANFTYDPYTAASWDAYLGAVDGVMVEDFALGWRRSALAAGERRQQWQRILAAHAAGKSLLLVAQGGRDECARLQFTFALASTLVEPGGAPVYYRYNDAFTDDYRQVWWRPEYTAPLPAPRAAARTADERVRREYARGELQLDLADGSYRLPPLWQQAWPACPR
jgi:hypothetical protein